MCSILFLTNGFAVYNEPMPKVRKAEKILREWNALNPVLKKKIIRFFVGTLFILITVFHARNDLLCILLCVLGVFIFALGEIKRPKYRKEEMFGAVLFSLFETVGNVEGWDLASVSPTFNFGTFRYLFFSLIGYFFFFRSLVALSFACMDRMGFKNHPGEYVSKKKFLLLFTLIGIVLWMPYFLANYPGLINADGWWQIEQANGHQSLNNWLSVIYTLIIRLLYGIGYGVFHDANAGIATISLVSVALMSFVFAECIYIAYINGVTKKGILLLAIFYYACPFNALYTITIWKDTFFGGAFVLFTTLLYDAVKNRRWDRKTLIALGISGFFVCTLRSNGLYAFLALIPFMVIFLNSKRKPVMIFLASILLTVGVFNGPVESLLNVKQNDCIESLSVPIQQIGYTVTHDGNLSKENEAALSQIADLDLISNDYIPYISDDLKDLLRNGVKAEELESNKQKYIDLWLSIGKDNPVYYIKGYALQTRGNYYFSNDYYWKFLTGITTPNQPHDAYYANPILGGSARTVLMNWAQFVDEQLYSRCWSISLSNWTCIILTLYLIKKKNKAFISVLPCIFLSATLMLATPVSQEFRYSYGVFLSVPILLALTATCQTKHRMNSGTRTTLRIFGVTSAAGILLLNSFPSVAKGRNTYVLTVIDKDAVETVYEGQTEATTLEELLNQRSDCGDFSYTTSTGEEGIILTSVNEQSSIENAKWAIKINYGDSIYNLAECMLPKESYYEIWILCEYQE